MFSLRTLVDDILLIVRNNNISESEDFSRAQIIAWVMHYKALLTKQEKERQENEDGNDDFVDEGLTKTIGPVQLEIVKSLDATPLFLRKTIEEIPDLFEKDPVNIISVFDQEGCPIQLMNNIRRHFHWHRKYTGRDLTWYYKNGNIYITGNVDMEYLGYIWVKYIAEEIVDEDMNEDDVQIPNWMIPEIKNRIFKNELAFMVRMPSDDDNNATLDGIKPNGPQDKEK